MPRAGRIVTWAALALLLASAVRPVWSIDPDAAAYLALGRSLAAGEGYALDGLPHAKYPPGLPVLLAALVSLAGPEAYVVFHLALVAALLGAVLLAGALARRCGYPEPVVFAVAACTGLSQTFFSLAVVYLRSEALFTAVSLAALLLMERSLTARQRSVGLLAAAALGAGAACLVRMAGVALLAVPAVRLLLPGGSGGAGGQAGTAEGPPAAAAGGYSPVAPATPASAATPATPAGPSRREIRIRAAAVLLVGVLPLLAWQARAAAIQRELPDAPDYRAEFWAAEPRDLTKTVRVDMPPLDAPALARRVRGNLEVQARAMASLLTNADRAAHRLPVGALLLVVVLAGAGVLWRQGGLRRDGAVYLLATLALYLVWPFNQLGRFYAPLLPLLLLAAGSGLAAGLRLAHRVTGTRAGRLAALAAAGAVVVVLALQRSDHPRWLDRYSTAYAALLGAAAAAWLVALAWLGAGRRTPEPSARAAWLAPLLFAVPFLHARFVEHPRRVERFEARRASRPADGPLARIDVHEMLEDVALFLTEHTAPDAVVMTDVPKMMAIMSGRRCVPFAYSVAPPQVHADDVDFVFYTGELAEAEAVLDACAPRFEIAFSLQEPTADGGTLRATVYRTR